LRLQLKFSSDSRDLSTIFRKPSRGKTLIKIIPIYLSWESTSTPAGNRPGFGPDPSLTQEGKEELFEEWGEAGLHGVKVGIANPDPLAAGVGAGNDLDSAHGKAQDIGQQAAAGCIGLPLDRGGTD